MADMRLVLNLGFVSEGISKACIPPNQTLHRSVFIQKTVFNKCERLLFLTSKYVCKQTLQ